MKPTICMVSHHACIRVFKESRALISKGYKVKSLATVSSMGWNLFDSYLIYFDKEMLIRTIKDMKDVDIFHVHNEPDWLVGWVREATDKPIVYDCHDLQSLRTGEPPEKDEVTSFGYSDAVVHVSEACRQDAHKKHGPKNDIVLHSYVNSVFLPGKKKLSSVCENALVYEGGIVEQPDMIGNKANYRYFMPMVQSFINQGYLVSIFSANAINLVESTHKGAVCSGPHPYPVLLRALRPHAFGFVGACMDAAIMQAAMPNKLFEYMSQGVVPVVMNCNESAKFVESYNCGFVISDFNNLKEKLVGLEEKRKNAIDISRELTMENQIHKLEQLYGSL